MAGFSVNGRNKISYKVGSDGKVTVNVNGNPVGTFADKTAARQFTSEVKTAIKGIRDKCCYKRNTSTKRWICAYSNNQ